MVTGAPTTPTPGPWPARSSRRSLVKAAAHGRDPNWGRIAGAAGNARLADAAVLEAAGLTAAEAAARGGTPGHARPGPAAHRDRRPPVFDGVAGGPLAFDRAAAASAMDAPEVVIGLDLGLGDGTGEAFGCDLTEAYVDRERGVHDVSEILVVKLGGTTIADQSQVLAEVAAVARRRPVVLVHGGGKRITEWLERLGVPTQVRGRPAGHRRAAPRGRRRGPARRRQQRARRRPARPRASTPSACPASTAAC